MKLKKDERILFIGDSITDAGRNRADSFDLGNGYPFLVAETLKKLHPELGLTFYNRGISGNKINYLEGRWMEDCIALKPTVVSILIGINDTWHSLFSPSFASEEALAEFEASYRNILVRTKEETDAKIVMMEPFVLSYPEDRLSWREDLDPRIQVIRRLANEFADEYIPLDGYLNATGMKLGYQALTGDDGVHPTPTGHQHIADAWLQVLSPML